MHGFRDARYYKHVNQNNCPKGSQCMNNMLVIMLNYSFIISFQNKDDGAIELCYANFVVVIADSIY